MARIALLFNSFVVGGIARSNLRIADEFLRQGHQVDLLVGTREGELYGEKPEAAREVLLSRSGRWTSALQAARLPHAAQAGRLRLFQSVRKGSGKQLYGESIAAYIQASAPDVIFARTAPLIVSAVLGRSLAESHTPIIGSEHNRLQTNPGKTPPDWRYGMSPQILEPWYRQCDALVTVSEGIRREILANCTLQAETVHTIHNPVVDDSLRTLADFPPPHPWLESPDIPVIVSVGKLNPQKDHGTLLRALAEVVRTRDARLILVGGVRDAGKAQEYLAGLQQLTADLGLSDRVDFVGHQGNPFAYMRHAALFVLSSRWEGLGNVLIEALACGCPVVSTDCISGPREILADGRYGALVPVGDAPALARAIGDTLDAPLPTEQLRQRAEAFSTAAIARQYLDLLNATARTA